MELRAAEISEIIKRQIQSYGKQVELRETGTVLSAGDGIARIYGLDRVAEGHPHEVVRLHGPVGDRPSLSRDGRALGERWNAYAFPSQVVLCSQARVEDVDSCWRARIGVCPQPCRIDEAVEVCRLE